MNSNDLGNSSIKNQKEKDNKNTNLIDENSWIKQVNSKKSTQLKEQDLSQIIRRHSIKKNFELKNGEKNRNSLMIDRGNLKSLLIPENSTESNKSINSESIKNKKEENSDNNSNIISESNNESESQNENKNEFINNNKEYVKKYKNKNNKNNEINSEIKEENTEENKDEFNSKQNKILKIKKKNPNFIINKILSTEDKFQMLRQSYLKIPNLIISKKNQKKNNNNKEKEKEKEIIITPMSNSDNPELELLTHNPENRPINPFSIKCALLSDKGPLSARYNIDNNINNFNDDDNINEKKVCKTYRKSTFGYLNEMCKSSSENNIFKQHYGHSTFNIIAPYTYRMDNINKEFFNVDNNQKKIFKHKKSKSSCNIIMPVNSDYKNSNYNTFIRNIDNNNTNKIINDYSSNNSNLLKSSEEYNSLSTKRNLYNIRYPKKNLFKKIINNKNLNKEYLISNLVNILNNKDNEKNINKHKKSNSISLSYINCFSPSQNKSQDVFNMKVNKIKNFLKLGKFNNGKINNYKTINNKEIFYKYSDSKFKKQIFPPNVFDSKNLIYFK